MRLWTIAGKHKQPENGVYGNMLRMWQNGGNNGREIMERFFISSCTGPFFYAVHHERCCNRPVAGNHYWYLQFPAQCGTGNIDLLCILHAGRIHLAETDEAESHNQ